MNKVKYSYYKGSEGTFSNSLRFCS